MGTMTVSSRTPQRNAVVPPAARPGAAGAKRTLMGYELVIAPSLKEHEVYIVPVTMTSAGNRVGGHVRVNGKTWNAIKNDNGALQALVHGKAEAVRRVKVEMVDVSAWSRQPTVPANRPKPMAPVTGIKALCKDIQGLVADMAGNQHPTADQQRIFATRYGQYRDAMADLRATFLAAEGEFETAQHLLVRMMGGDE